MIKEVIGAAVNTHIIQERNKEERDIKGLVRYIEDVLMFREKLDPDKFQNMSKNDVEEFLFKTAMDHYAEKEAEFGEEQMREVERVVLLRSVDFKWMDHIDAMDQLKQGIGLRAYRQRDPVQEYQIEGMNMFEEMVYSIKEDTLRMIYRVRAERKVEREKVAEPTSTNYDDSVKREPVRKDKKTGRNDQCPCGSGKKYKNCCGRNA
jgi:preprotein translocase subunit SecA